MRCIRFREACAALAAGLLLAGAAAVAAPPPPRATASATPVVGAPPATAATGSAAVKPTPHPQAIRVDAVNIEGKLYSPQALFIMSRPAESFGRDAVVPDYLRLAPATAALPYRLRPELLGAAAGPLATPAAQRAD